MYIFNIAKLVDTYMYLCNIQLFYSMQIYMVNILLAVNPYCKIGNLYSLEIFKRYNGKPFGVLPPHIFVIG